MKKVPQPDHRLPEDRVLESARWRLVRNFHRLTDRAMIFLSLVWLLLVVVEFSAGLTPALEAMVYALWALFIADFLAAFALAPGKKRYLASHWLTAVSLVLPAMRVFRAFRAFRLLRTVRSARSLRLLRMITSMNRGITSVRATMRRRGIGYLALLTALVAVTGAAGMANFESPRSLEMAGKNGPGLASYGDALWWTAMLIATFGTDYWPKTAEGRILCWLLSVYAIGVFSYMTAAIASHFIGVDEKNGVPQKT